MTVSAYIARSRREKEDWKYTNLDTLLTPIARPAIGSHYPHQKLTSEGSRFLFINGIWQPKQSHFGSVPSCILLGDADSGYKLTLGEHTCLVIQPIEMVFIVNDAAPSEVNIKLSIDVGANGRLTLLENHISSGCITTVEIDITLHAQAKFVHGKIVQGGAQLATTIVTVATGAYYNNFSLLQGGQPIRNEMNVRLSGINAQATLNGLMLLDGHAHIDTSTCIAHQAPHCTSRQIYKTVLNDKSHGVFQGKIIVAKDAQKTDGYQLSRTLLLSDQAEMDARPELEIYADDVKCSHGSSISNLDEDALFYLRARGLSETEARTMLVNAFIIEMLDEIHNEEWRDVFQHEIERWAA